MRSIRVLIVDDAATVRRLVADALSADPGVEVVGTAANGRLALDRLSRLEPDIVILDLEMPVMDGLQTLAELRKTRPRLPVIIFTSHTARGADTTLDALALGANDYVSKPRGGSLEASLRHAREELIPRIRALCSGVLIAGEPPTRGRLDAASDRTPWYARRSADEPPVEVVAIGTSTGGPSALSVILPALPAGFPAPILVVQHMPPVFTAHLAERLNARCPLRVAEGVEGAVLGSGQVWIAPGDWHMVLRRFGREIRLGLHRGPAENSCRPAADELFRSVAQIYGAGALAVVLTGMGQDGLRGCECIRAAGGRVLAQDGESSAVWGMPGAVVRAGLAEAVLPLSEIAGEIARRAASGRRGRGAA